jgi:putative endonuclease
MKKTKYSPRRRLGNIGEDVACRYLRLNGHHIKDRNYLKKWGELDIVSIKGKTLRFIEVKAAVTRENDNAGGNQATFVSRCVSQIRFTLFGYQIRLSHETQDDNSEVMEEYRPEDNVHFWKQKRILRTIESFIMEKSVDEDQEWQIDVIVVRLDISKKTAIIRHIENVIFDV